MANDPKILNLDDLETASSSIKVVHQGTDHFMRVLDVDQFIEQQKREIKKQKMMAEAEEAGDKDMAEVMTMIRDSISNFFPTLPVGQLPVPKLFVLFAWLNEIGDKLNADGAPDSGEGVTASAEGNAEAVPS